MLQILRREAARRDLVEHFVYLAEHADISTADRFLEQIEESLAALSSQPRMGSPIHTQRPELAGIRKWPVKDFENWLIFYIPDAPGFTVVRILHAAQDWWAMLSVGTEHE